MVEQQMKFFDVLEETGAKLIHTTPLWDCPDQLNTRDPSFVIGNTFFVSSMKETLRVNEKKGLSKIIDSIESQIVYLDNCTIEGGDVLLMYDTVFVGISRRTSLDGVKQLKKHLPQNYNILPIYLKNGFLHLDTVFNILTDEDAIICSAAIEDDSIRLLENYFSIVDISLEEQLHLGTNILNISPRKIITQTQNKRINKELNKRGFEIIEVEYSEIAKLGGAFRCGTCPLVRE